MILPAAIDNYNVDTILFKSFNYMASKARDHVGRRSNPSTMQAMVAAVRVEAISSAIFRLNVQVRSMSLERLN